MLSGLIPAFYRFRDRIGKREQLVEYTFNVEEGKHILKTKTVYSTGLIRARTRIWSDQHGTDLVTTSEFIRPNEDE